MRIAYVPASVLAAEKDFRASTYLQPTLQQEQRLATARRRYQQAITGLTNVARERREVRHRQARLGIIELPTDQAH